MGEAFDRFQQRRAARGSITAFEEVEGETSDDVSKYLPLATGALSEVVTSELKKKEEAKKAAAYRSSEAGKAEQAAKDARKNAQLAAASAVVEADPNGPLHRAAQQADLQARSAEAKAAIYQSGAVPSGGGLAPYGAPSHGGSSLFTTRNVLIGAGVLGALAVIFLVRRK